MQVWDVEEGKAVAEAGGHGGKQVKAMYVYGDNLVTGGEDGTVMVWKLGGGGLEVHRTFNVLEKARGDAGKSHGVTSVCGHGSRVYSGVAGEGVGEGNDVLVWDVEGNKYVNKMGGHRSWVTGMAILMEGKFLATVSHDCTIRIWSVENRNIQFFGQANRTPGQVEVDPTGLLGVVALPQGAGEEETGKQGMVTISEGGMVDLWEVTTKSGMVEVHHVEGGRHGEPELEHGCVGVFGGKGGGGEGRWGGGGGGGW